jgi:hypothetical protein
MAALEVSDEDEARKLLRGGADITVKDDRGWTALDCAARFSSPQLLAELLRSGAGVELADFTLESARQQRLRESSKSSSKSCTSKSVFTVHKKPSALSQLLKRRCSRRDCLNRVGLLCLMLAIGESAWRDQVIARRANKTSEKTSEKTSDDGGKCIAEQARVAFVNAASYCGERPLHTALSSDNLNPLIVKVLLLNGASCSVQNDEGSTPLAYLERGLGAFRDDDARRNVVRQLHTLVKSANEQLCRLSWPKSPRSLPFDESRRDALLALCKRLRGEQDLEVAVRIDRHPLRQFVALVAVDVVALSGSDDDDDDSVSSSPSSRTAAAASSRDLHNSSPQSGGSATSHVERREAKASPHTLLLFTLHSSSSEHDRSTGTKRRFRHQSAPPGRFQTLERTQSSPGGFLHETAPSASSSSSSSSSSMPTIVVAKTRLHLLLCNDIVLITSIAVKAPSSSSAASNCDALAFVNSDGVAKALDKSIESIKLISVFQLERVHVFDVPDEPELGARHALQLVYLNEDPSRSGSWTIELSSANAKHSLWSLLTARHELSLSVRMMAARQPRALRRALAASVHNEPIVSGRLAMMHAHKDTWSMVHAELTNSLLRIFPVSVQRARDRPPQAPLLTLVLRSPKAFIDFSTDPARLCFSLRIAAWHFDATFSADTLAIYERFVSVLQSLSIMQPYSSSSSSSGSDDDICSAGDSSDGSSADDIEQVVNDEIGDLAEEQHDDTSLLFDEESAPP